MSSVRSTPDGSVTTTIPSVRPAIGGVNVQNTARKRPNGTGTNTVVRSGMLVTEALAQVVTQTICTAIAAIRGGLRPVGLKSEKVQFPVTAVAGCHGDLLFCTSGFVLSIIPWFECQ